ncbi:sugar phosphate isomerase/epimerase [Methanoplanus sp. FWC-SCC4]|uniref:Sugar phosphate isomerase/epimerase n=1 Tax=Methanochimaera problematica TaxID=2609417 RepID=A0AA97I3Q1_9EURY|nr:sugar phosphate isomerase/epimerase family protein [Methanoplanus sp. FWC-SCC4]WOF16136.1 sugar phosphate isomerase/epimerase [Methanoplanus sp. FWC-SCC4]
MYGVSTHCLFDKPLETALYILSDITDTVEIMNDGLHFIDSPEIPECFSFDYYFHAPSRGVNIASHLEPIRKASVEVVRNCMSTASEIDAGGVVVHPGYFGWISDKDVGIFQLQKSLIELKKISDEYSVPFFIENMPKWDYFFLQTTEDLPLITDFMFALDTGHAFMNNCLDEFLKTEISHFHLHDNDGKSDSHMAVGDGMIDFAPVIKALSKNKGFPIIEVATLDGVKRSISALNKL